MANNGKLSVALTFDFDAMSLWIGSFDASNPSMLSRGEFGAVAIPRILALLKKNGIRGTFCVPGHTAFAYPRVVRSIADAGHEIAHHSWCHENPAKFDRDGERRDLEKGLAALENVAGVRPRGYRSPAWDLSTNTIDILMEFGFEYDSSCMGNDFYPYYLRNGDQVTKTDPFHFGEVVDLVEVPVTWGLDDFPPFEFVWGQNPGLSAPSAVEEIWRGDFDYALRDCPGGIYNLTMHPQVIGRGHRMLMLERLIAHMKARQGVVFEPLGDYVSRWRQDHPMDKWRNDNAHLIGIPEAVPA